MNKQNFRIWSTQKPIEVFEKPLHAPKVTVWSGLSSHRVYGPFFFEDAETGNACSVNTEAYIEMLNTVMTDDIHLDVCTHILGCKRLVEKSLREQDYFAPN